MVHHIAIIFTLLINSRPHRYHQFDSHLVKLICHFLWIRPIYRIKLIISLLCPMEIIYYDYRQRNAKFFVFPCNIKNLLLIFISKLTLPETKCPLRNLRSMSCQIGKFFAGFLGITRNNHIIHCFCAVAVPTSSVISKFNPAGGWHIPQKTIS